MDQRLILALENLGNALEEIASSLQSKEEAKTSSVQALKAGDFGKQLESISKQLTSIKADTQEILKEQKTIQSMSKQKEVKKETPMEEIGKDKKKESALKKGLGTILLIAVAVLAIGMAFKLVGEIDFLSVIALGLAIYVVAEAFAKIASLNLSLREAMVASLTMVTMSIAITLSSFILRRIVPVGMIQLLTAVAIAGVFATIGMSLERLAVGLTVFKKVLGIKNLWTVPVIMVAIATAITASSYVMSGIVPIGMLQALTAIAIAGVFAIIGLSLQRIATAIVITDKILGKKATWIFPLILVAVATAITLSSWVMAAIVPIGLLQALTAIGISIMFAIIGFTMVEIATAIVLIDKIIGKKASFLLPLVLVAIATAITMSSWILQMITPIDLFQFLTALGIAILFAVMSYFFVPIAIGVTLVDKIVGKGASLLIPLVFVAIALAIMLSSHILAMTAKMDFQQILNITLFGIGLGLVVLAMLPSVLLVGIAAVSGVGAGAIALGVLMIPLIAAAVAISSHIIAMGKYTKYPSLGWVVAVGLAMTGFGAAVIALGVIALTGLGLPAILAGSLLVPLIANTIVEVDRIIAKGRYNKYPGWKWILSVGATMTGFGAAVVALGILSIQGLGLGALAIIIGTKMVPKIANTIVEVDRIISKGKYKKYPGWKWILSVGATMTGFGAAVVALGILSITGLGLGALAIIAGTKMVPKIAEVIVAVDKIIARGNYKKYPGAEWALSVGSLMTVFGAAVLGVGVLIVSSFGIGYLAIKAGAKAVKTIAQSIVDVAWIFNKNSGAFKKGPSKDWAEGVSIAIGAFAPVYRMLVTNSIMKIFGGSGPTPKQFAKAITTISEGIVDAAWFFSNAKVAFEGGPKKEWSEGVGKAIGAFAPVYEVLAANSGWFASGVSVEDMKKAIITISKGIIESAGIFAENKATFDGGYPTKEWGLGVGAAIGAFAPIFKSLSKDTGWFTSGDDVINNMVNAVIRISKAIVRVANIFGYSKSKWDAYPSKKWSWNVKLALGSFIRLVKTVSAKTKTIKDVDYQNVLKTARNLVSVGRILNKGKKYFDLRINPNFMKNVGKNLLDFNNIVQKLAEAESKKSFFQKVGDTTDALLGRDPISQIASRMVMLAGAYDKLATALIKLGGAMKVLNISDTRMLVGFTRALARSGPIGTDGDSKSPRRISAGKQELSKLKKVDTKGRISNQEDEKEKKLFKKMDDILKVLKNIDRSVSSVDEYIADQSEGQYPKSGGSGNGGGGFSFF